MYLLVCVRPRTHRCLCVRTGGVLYAFSFNEYCVRDLLVLPYSEELDYLRFFPV
jgi:hypothetical protein